MNCRICGKGPIYEGEKNVAKVKTEKGCSTINRASGIRNLPHIVAEIGTLVHEECRAKHINKKSLDILQRGNPGSPFLTTRSSSKTSSFSFKTHCVFCGKYVEIEPTHPKRLKIDEKFSCVSTLNFDRNIEECINKRQDEWAEEVKGRISQSVADLHASDAIYHQVCSSNFRTGKERPQPFLPERPRDTNKRKAGRPIDTKKDEVFLKVVDYFKSNDEENFTVADLASMMKQYLPEDQEPYDHKTIKHKLSQVLGDQIIISTLEGKADVVSFRTSASIILQDYHKRASNLDNDDEATLIIKTASKLIKNDIEGKQISNEFYPSFTGIADLHSDEVLGYIPESLRSFLKDIFTGKSNDLKVAAIGQAIMQASRPKALIAPLQIALGVQLHHHFSSKFLIQTLYQLGFSKSYTEILNYQKSAAVYKQDTLLEVEPTNGEFLQWSADNVDHNLVTLDGKNTIHIMGIIATVTPGRFANLKIPRRTKISSKEIAGTSKIDISYYKGAPPSDLKFKSLPNFDIVNPSWSVDLLWKTTLLFRVPRSSWLGTMQAVYKGNVEYTGKTETILMPMIDMDPNDLSCIYSTLKFVAIQSSKQGCVAILTFDQPLFWKASKIVDNEKTDSYVKSVILRLGGLHLEMSFLSSMGHLLSGSGLKELLSTVYAEQTVPHMLSGKAISRAIRGHLLNSAALNTLLMAQCLEVPLPETYPQVPSSDNTVNTSLNDTSGSEVQLDIDDDFTSAKERSQNVLDELSAKERSQDVLDQLSKLFEDLLSHKESPFNANNNITMLKLYERFNDLRATLKDKTSILWFMYLDMVDILCAFIKGERTGDWNLHLQAMGSMLPYLASSGHFKYVKSVTLYLQKMAELESTYPFIYKKFCDGYHVVRKSDRDWAGLSTDLAIEQELMRNIKASGGLTHGGMRSQLTESQRQQWILSMPACAGMNRAVQMLTEVHYESSEQHHEMGAARQERDSSDTLKLLNFLLQRNPFDGGEFRSIATGELADAEINVDKAYELGKVILEKMAGQSVYRHSFTKKDLPITMANKSAINTGDEVIQIDPNLLFQRLATLSQQECGRKDIFSYELCAFPAALFDSPVLPRPPNKAKLADYMWDLLEQDEKNIHFDDSEVDLVLDGGALLHKLPWPKDYTYTQICSLYCDYLQRKYGKPTIVFDGYVNGPSIKDATHIRRSKKIGKDIVFQPDMKMTGTKDEFLANESNKQRFINLLSQHLEDAGMKVHHAMADADTLIVDTAVKLAKEKDTCVIGNDTDLLILLVDYAFKSKNLNKLYMKSETKSTNGTYQRIWPIQELIGKLGEVRSRNILFAHAILGCDSTSHVFGFGKPQALKMLDTEDFAKVAEIFLSPNSSKEDIEKASERCFLLLYKSLHLTESLDELRYIKFHQKVATNKTAVLPQTLPQTSAAAKYHGFRVHYQIMEWSGHTHFRPEEWGWKLRKDKLLPITTDQSPAPEILLKKIHCGCKGKCAINSNCSCRKHGLPCSYACGNCRGISCENRQVADFSTDSGTDGEA